MRYSVDQERASELLETFTLEEILEHSDLTEEDVLVALAEQGLLKIPEVEPL